MRKLCAIALLLVLTLLILTGCYSGYSGEHIDLYTVAINSLLWTNGWSMGYEARIDSKITILEQDNYGRVLFEYSESLFASGVSFSSIVVMQNCSDDFVYYYEDINFVSKEKEAYDTVEFDKVEKNQLKESNDWNKPLNLEKCVAKQVSNQKADLPSVDKQLDELFSTYDGYSSNKTSMLTYDEYGRFICYATIWTENNAASQRYLVMLFQKDLTFSILEPQSIFSYQEELAEFKRTNNWHCE